MSMEEWKEYRLGDFMQFNPKEKIAKGKVSRKIAMDQLVPFCRDVDSQVYEEYKGGAKFRNGDTIMARITPCLENGKTSYISSLEDDEVAFGSTEYIVLRNIEGVSDSRFVYYLSICPEIRGVAIKSMVGSSGRQRVQQDVLENYCVSLPSLPTQQKIANILSSLDDKIEVNRRINEQLEELAQPLFKSWFIDFEPFKDGEFEDSKLGMIPKGWKVGTLGDVADVVMGSSPAGSSYNTEGDGSIFYQGRTDFGFRFPCVRMYTTEPKRFAESNSVLLSVRAPVGDVNIAFEKCCIGRGLASIKSNCNADSYTYYLMKSLKPVLDNYNNEGTVFGCINKDALNNLSIVVPTVEIIEEFERIASSFDVEIRRRSEEITHLTTLRNTLLPKLMSGEIDVNEVEI